MRGFVSERWLTNATSANRNNQYDPTNRLGEQAACTISMDAAYDGRPLRAAFSSTHPLPNKSLRPPSPLVGWLMSGKLTLVQKTVGPQFLNRCI